MNIETIFNEAKNSNMNVNICLTDQSCHKVNTFVSETDETVTFQNVLGIYTIPKDKITLIRKYSSEN